MKHSSSRVQVLSTVLVAAIALVSASRPAGAASDGSEAPPSDEPVERKETAVEPKPAVNATAMLVGVERLPDGAYPEPETRGIPGGSLGLTFHGLQWPYMPAVGGGTHLVLGFSGWAWVDTAYEKITHGAGSTAKDKITYWLQQGRVVLCATPTFSSGTWFVQAQLEVVGNGDQSTSRASAPDTDDLWVRIGQWNSWDIQLGRYEAWEVFHLGMGLDLNTLERRGAATSDDTPSQIDFYGLTDNYYRPSGVGDVALHVYPTRYLRFEVLGQAGNQGGFNNELGIRPVGIFDIGWLKVKGGFEYQRQTPSRSSALTKQISQGFGGSVQLVLNPFLELGVNAAQGTVELTDQMGRPNLAGSVTRTSFGGFANGRLVENLVLGVGVLYTGIKDINVFQDTGRVDFYSHFQAFGALQYVFFKQLYLKLVIGYAQAYYDDEHTSMPSPYTNTMVSARIRASFYF